MKKNLLTKVFLAALVLSTISCKKDLLNQPPYGVQTDASYFRTSDDLNKTLTAAYNYLQQPVFPPYESGRWVFGDVGSDDALKGAGGSTFPIAGISELSLNQQTSGNYIISIYWTNLYNMIAICNLVLDKQSIVSGDADEIKKIANQARFLRAYGYYELVKYFGDVPMPLTYLDPAKVNLARTPKAGVWAQIEKDLTDASALPTKAQWGSANDGRAASGAAFALLGKAYMFQKKFADAEATLKKVIDQGSYSLLPDYGAIFRKTGDNDNAESVFDIKHKANTGTFPGEGSFNYAFLQPSDAPIAGFGQDEPSQDLQNEFERGDPRAIYTILFSGDSVPNGASPYVVANSGTAAGKANRKFFIPPSEKVAYIGSLDEAKSNHIIRYAEILLLYAEALNENGKSSEALTWINKVRQRARTTPAKDPQRISTVYDLSYTGPLLPDITTTDQSALRTAIWHEQRVELAMEGLRREYLSRTGRLSQRMAAAKGIAAFNDKYVLLPIPQLEVSLSNNQITQNPGY
ncbi:RagB/SusD family nutrient uptake outer membrane protein [Mucilaginibacter sp. cycad4]|uniref:RagB/SusD family nutrient uptake outer membrane protein n=1 Tax=Mucilaginibacter sp. cycad4 TaxID=3342096 RepID=UPI002AAB8B0B|nr:RagB/SusD family nutrient uptake outer membrane protein [Mucilaginibacter gossypii]WPV02017.1 RagB/SusD family nutrient uptake outer membrane protein [Mucilaginibacter gossypii]